MASVQEPYKAPPGTVIRPDGTPVGSVRGSGMMWLGILVVGGGVVAFAMLPDYARDDTVVARAPAVVPEEVPVPVAVPEPVPVEPEPVRDPLEALDIVEPGLYEDQIDRGLAKADKDLRRCWRKSDFAGPLELDIQVSAAGTVTSVETVDSPDPTLVKCLAKAIAKVRFAKADAPSEFTRTFSF